MTVIGNGYAERLLTEEEVRSLLERGLGQADLDDKRVLVIIPDGTRSGPADLFFHKVHELLHDRVDRLDFLIALGTHQPMSDEAIREHLGFTAEEREGRYADVGIYNHAWKDPGTLMQLGTISSHEIEELSEGRLSISVPVMVNKMIYDYDQLVICGPVFPHEVVGYSGGNKYFFPGISGQEVIDATHWLGALITSMETIGHKYTPVRAVIDRAAALIDRPKLCLAYVVKGEGVAGLYVSSPEEAWSAAADLSAQIHVKYVPHRYRTVLSMIPEMYDDIWTGAKGMYKLEPVIEDGGQVILYAPHVSEISYTHGEVLEAVGYHVRDYFVKQWDRFKSYPWGVLAHSTHLRGQGTYEDGVEKPRIEVTLATQIPKELCHQVNLGYLDPDSIDPEAWQRRAQDDESVLVVPHAGEHLHLLEKGR